MPGKRYRGKQKPDLLAAGRASSDGKNCNVRSNYIVSDEKVQFIDGLSSVRSEVES